MQGVIIAAGESSRFWPVSENRHKSLTKIMGKTIISWTIDALKNAGLEEIIIVESKERSIERTLNENVSYAVQEEAKGMGNAIHSAKQYIKDDFFVLNPNHFSIEGLISKMIEIKNQNDSQLVLLGTRTKQPWEYGILRLENHLVKELVEKPEKGKEPSDIKVVGIYLLPKEYFSYYEKVRKHMYDHEDTLQLIINNNRTNMVYLENESPSLKYPWDLFKIKNELMRLFLKREIKDKKQVSEKAIIEGEVHIGNNTRIYENAVIKGPCYIGNNCVIGNNAIIRKGSSIEDDCLIGSNVEISNCIIQQGTHLHSGYIGDSIIGTNCRIGAGIITANRRIDRNEIYSYVKGKKVNTGLDYFGCIIGDNTALGISVGIMPGVMIGCDCVIGPQTNVKENIESKTIYYSEIKGTKKARK